MSDEPSQFTEADMWPQDVADFVAQEAAKEWREEQEKHDPLVPHPDGGLIRLSRYPMR